MPEHSTEPQGNFSFKMLETLLFKFLSVLYFITGPIFSYSQLIFIYYHGSELHRILLLVARHEQVQVEGLQLGLKLRPRLIMGTGEGGDWGGG